MSTSAAAAAPPFRGVTLRTLDACGAQLFENRYGAGSVLPRHQHETAFFSWTLAGGYVEGHGGRAVEYDAGSIAFHPAGEEHSVAIGRRDVRCLNVEVRPEWVARAAEVAGEAPRFVRAVGGPLVWLARRLYDEAEGGPPAPPLGVESAVLEMLSLLGPRLPASDRLPPRWLDRVEEVLRRDYRAPLTLSHLAREAGVHPVHLSRTWRRFRRSSLGDAVRRLRVDEARRLLATGRGRLVDVALYLGFADQAQFTRAFRRVTGLTPRAYRLRFGSAFI
jgi:AraC family transcriptional regulator